MAKLILAILVLSLAVSLSSAQTYDLRNDVLDEGGTKMASSGYIGRGSFGQSTIGKISSADYIAIIGFWHPPYAPPGVEEQLLVSGSVPMVFSLSQNYPNPFSRSTTIRYALPDARHMTQDARHVTLAAYDLSGRVVRTLVDEAQEPGYYSVTWDLRGVSGKRLPNGVYFYRISAWGFRSTKKLVVLR